MICEIGRRDKFIVIGRLSARLIPFQLSTSLFAPTVLYFDISVSASCTS